MTPQFRWSASTAGPDSDAAFSRFKLQTNARRRVHEIQIGVSAYAGGTFD
jgi:hypothetical protein